MKAFNWGREAVSNIGFLALHWNTATLALLYCLLDTVIDHIALTVGSDIELDHLDHCDEVRIYQPKNETRKLVADLIADRLHVVRDHHLCA